jgi:hypothetical protein
VSQTVGKGAVVVLEVFEIMNRGRYAVTRAPTHSLLKVSLVKDSRIICISQKTGQRSRSTPAILGSQRMYVNCTANPEQHRRPHQEARGFGQRGHRSERKETHRFRVTIIRPDKNMPEVLRPSAVEWVKLHTDARGHEPKFLRYHVPGSLNFISRDASRGSSMTLDMVPVQKHLARKWRNEVITRAQQRFVLHLSVADALTPGSRSCNARTQILSQKWS